MQSSVQVGIVIMIVTMLVFAIQDGISRHLATEYNVMMIVMIRYWFFAAFVIFIARRKSGSIAKAAATKQPVLQIFRGLLLAAEINVMVLAFVLLGLIESLAVFASYPLIVAALAAPVLGEVVPLRRWIAIGVGFIGILIILQPGYAVFAPAALVPLLSAVMFALYSLLTRFAARKDSAATSFFWTGVSGAVLATAVGIWFWEPMTTSNWLWMLALCVSGATGHYLLIRAYEIAEANTLQPFAYLQLVFGSIIGITLLGETLETHVLIGAIIIVGAGLFTITRRAVR